MTGSPALGVLLPGFDGPELPRWVAQRLDRGLAGVCLFGSNVESPRQLRRLTDAIVSHNPRALVAIDEEGGDVTRLYYDRGAPTPGNAWLGRLDDVAATRRAAAGIAGQLCDVGVNLNLAPSVDINSNDANPVIGVRSFGADPTLVAAHSRAWIEGHQAMGVAACAKHFPGHGDTALDSHLSLPTVDLPLEQLLARELVPFEAAVAADVWSVMTSHILLPQLDPARAATFSPAILRGLLRDELGFTGVVVSDALDMAGASARIGIPAAAVDAVRGGCDLLCIGAGNSAEQVDEIARALDAAAMAADLAEALERSASRTAGLGERMAQERSVPGELPETFADPQPDRPLDVASAFAISARARKLLDGAAERARWTVVVLDTVPNNAAGMAPWGIEAAREAGDDLVAVHIDSSVGRDFATTIPAEYPVAVVGRDIHRHDWTRAIVDDLRGRRPDLLVVDMGWPDATRAYADIATFGASRGLGRAVLELLVGQINAEGARS